MERNKEAIILEIKGSDQFKSFLMAHNMTVGTQFTLNYSPTYSKLVNLTVANKMLSLRSEEFEKIVCQGL